MLRDPIMELTTSPRKFSGLTSFNIQMLTKIQLNDQEWSIISILEEILNPISKATNILSGRHYATLSSAFYVRKGLLRLFGENFSTVVASDDDRLNEIKQLLKNMVYKYLRIYFIEKCTIDQQNKTLLAAFLDPQVFKFLDEADLNKVKHELQIMFPIQRGRRRSSASQNIISAAQVLPTPNPTPSVMDDFADMCFLEPVTQTNSNNMDTITSEYNYYLVLMQEESGLELKQFWKRYEKKLIKLSSLVKKVMFILILEQFEDTK